MKNNFFFRQSDSFIYFCIGNTVSTLNLDDMAEHNDFGKWGEEMAVEYLHRRGYTIRETDWRYGHRDIDIIALTEDMRTLVFIEVKTRSSCLFERPEDAVDRKKIRSIGYAANAYVKQNQITMETRFDILTIVGSKDEGIPQIEHLEDAFNPMLAF